MYQISKIISVAEYASKELKGSYQLLMKLKKRLDETIRNNESSNVAEIASFGSEAAEIVAEFDDYHRPQLAHCYTIDEVITKWIDECQQRSSIGNLQIFLDEESHQLSIVTESCLSAELLMDVNKYEVYSSFILCKFSNQVSSIRIVANVTRFL